MTAITKGIADALTGPTIRVMDHVKVTEGTSQILKAHNSIGFVIITENKSGGQVFSFCEDFRDAATNWLKILKELETK